MESIADWPGGVARFNNMLGVSGTYGNWSPVIGPLPLSLASGGIRWQGALCRHIHGNCDFAGYIRFRHCRRLNESVGKCPDAAAAHRVGEFAYIQPGSVLWRA